MLTLMELRQELSGNDLFMSVVKDIEYSVDINEQFPIMHIMKV